MKDKEEKDRLEEEKEENLEDLLDSYKKDKEQIREMVGMVGGSGKKERQRDTIVNIIFLTLTVGVFVASFVFKKIEAIVGLEIGLLLLSLKIVLMIYKQEKVFHFQFWILSSLEFMLVQMDKKIKKIERSLDDKRSDK